MSATIAIGSGTDAIRLLSKSLQLTSKRAKSNVFPWQLAFVGLCQLRNILVDRIIEVEVPACMLIEQSERCKYLCDRSNTVLAVSINVRHARSLWVVLLCTVVLCP